MLFYLAEATKREALEVQRELLDLFTDDDIDIDLASEELSASYTSIWLVASKGSNKISIKWVTGNRVFTVIRDWEGHGQHPGEFVAGVKRLAAFVQNELEDI